MVVAQFVVRDGRVQARATLDLKTLDRQLMGLALDALDYLRHGKLTISNPIPEGPDFNVGLGLPVGDPTERLSPELIAFYEADQDPLKLEQRRTTFYMEHRGTMMFYHVVFSDAEREDA